MEKETNMIEYEYGDKVMGTDLTISIVTDSKELADNLAQKALSEIKSYEQKFSRFLPGSELSQLNLKKEMIVSKTFMEVILKAKELFKETDGAFNPLFQVEKLGYTKTFEEIKNTKFNNKQNQNFKKEKPEIYDFDFSKIIIDQNLSKIILSEGQKLDFGGMLKGYLAEKIARKIKNYHAENFINVESNKKINGVIVNIGGDIHTQGLDSDNQEFIFNIFNPINEQDEILIKLYNESLATSGTYKRAWQNNGLKTHHLLDKTGTKNPESDVVSVSVIHKDGGRADAYTKMFLNLGHEEAVKILGSNGIKFIIIKNNGEIIKKI